MLSACAVQPRLTNSQYLDRVAESGQLLLDRARHADVLEYLWWITSFSSAVYEHLHGDKDTFGFAFAMAGKLEEYMQVPVPPGATFREEKTDDGKVRHYDIWYISSPDLSCWLAVQV